MNNCFLKNVTYNKKEREYNKAFKDQTNFPSF